MSVNKIILVGRLGKDPEVKTLRGGGTVANFSVATSEKWKDQSGQAQERTTWHRISVFGRMAENCGKYLSKGKQVYIEGTYQSDQFTDKQGVERTFFYVKARTVQFLSPAGGSRRDENDIDRGGGGDFGQFDQGMDPEYGNGVPF